MSPNTWYWFALKTRDGAGNWSGLSTPFSVKTPGSGGWLSAETVRDENGSARQDDSAVPTAGLPGSSSVLVIEKVAGTGEWSVSRVRATTDNTESSVIRKYTRDTNGKEWNRGLQRAGREP